MNSCRVSIHQTTLTHQFQSLMLRPWEHSMFGEAAASPVEWGALG